MSGIDAQHVAQVAAAIALPVTQEDRDAVRGGHNLSTIQEHRLVQTLNVMWPGWRDQRKATPESALRFIELRESFIAGCRAYGTPNFARA